jgi:cytochrome c
MLNFQYRTFVSLAMQLPLLTVAGFLAVYSPVSAAPYPGCAAPTDNDFRMTTLVTQTTANLQEPLRMDFDMSAAGDVDIYFVEKAGNVRKYDALSKTVSTLGKVPVRTTGEHGLVGIALDPGFKTNKRLFLYYGSPAGAYEFRISRFTLTAGQLDLTSEKILIHIPADNNAWHTGGALAFDKQGNLWITVGDNHSDEGGAPNSNSFLGKQLRIHPEDDGTYTVPAGNLFTPGAAKTKPEIYTMGDRNPYSIAIDPQTGWNVWGEVGPDGYGQTEEFNLATHPGNYGWPYFAGYQKVMALNTTGMNPAAPVNNSPLNTGLTTLPPAITATYAYNEDCAITGPIYRYNAVPNSPIKMPPQFNGLWFVTDFNNYGQLGQTMDTMAVDQNGKPGPLGRIWPNWSLLRPTDFRAGPDGALYVMNYAGYFSTVAATSIARIEYTGTCRPATTRIADPAPDLSPYLRLAVVGVRLSVYSKEAAELTLRDLDGRALFSRRFQGAIDFDLSKDVKNRPALYLISLSDAANHKVVRKAFLGAP